MAEFFTCNYFKQNRIIIANEIDPCMLISGAARVGDSGVVPPFLKLKNKLFGKKGGGRGRTKNVRI